MKLISLIDIKNQGFYVLSSLCVTFYISSKPFDVQIIFQGCKFLTWSYAVKEMNNDSNYVFSILQEIFWSLEKEISNTLNVRRHINTFDFVVW